MAARQKLMTPLDYVAILTGAPPPPNEPEVQQIPVPTPVYMPNPRQLDEQAIYGDDPYMAQDPYASQQPTLPPPIATLPPDGMRGGNGFFAPTGGAFG